MPRDITITVYTYAELLEEKKQGKISGKAVECAATWLRAAATDHHDWYENVYEQWTEALTQIGFTHIEIAFTGFWSQGDGASFTAGVDLTKLIRFLSTPVEPSEGITYDGKTEDFRGWLVGKVHGVRFDPRYARLEALVQHYVFEMAIKRTSSNYCHYNTCSVEADFLSEFSVGGRARRLITVLWNDFVASVEVLRKDLCQALYCALQEEFEYLTSDEAIAEMAESNEYTFTIDGEREG